MKEAATLCNKIDMVSVGEWVQVSGEQRRTQKIRAINMLKVTALRKRHDAKESKARDTELYQ